MIVVVGSGNESKRLAVVQAFQAAYPDDKVDVVAVSAESDVSSHPLSGDEALRGALNRAAHARLLQTDADFYVGIEGGLVRVGEQAWEIGWIVIADSDGKVSTAVSSGPELRGKLLQAVLAGIELNDALNDQHQIKDIGKTVGFYGLVTDNTVNRDASYIQALLFALGQFKHPEYFV